MIDTDRLRPRISPLDVWRIGASFIFVGFGAYFILVFLYHLARPPHRTYTQLLLGILILTYGVWRLWSGLHNYRLMRRDRSQDPDAR